MALTVQSQPTTNQPQPSFAPIEYLVTSTQTAQTGFKVIASLHLQTGGNAKIATLQLNTIPSATQVVTDIQNIIQSYVDSEYSVLEGDTVGVSTISFSDFRIAFQEYYSGALQGSAVSGNVFNSWDSSPKYKEWATSEYTDWSINDLSTEANFLNGFRQDSEWFAFGSSNAFLKVRSTQKYQARWMFKGGASDTYQMWLITMDDSFTPILSTTLNLSNSKAIYTLDVGATELPTHAWASTPVMTNVKYYALRILNVTEDVFATDAIMFEVDDCDNTYTDYELHWLNRRGAYDSFVFYGKSNQTTEVQKNFAKYNTRTIDGSSILHNTYAQRKRAFHTALKDNYRLSSRLLKDFEVEGLEDLFTSPEVYWKDGDNFFAVNVTGSTYEHSKSENGQVYSMQLNIEVDNSDKRQW